jgi:hypothetical protein
MSQVVAQQPLMTEKSPIMRKHQTLISFLMTIPSRKQKCQPKKQDNTEKINLITFSFYFYYFYNAFFPSPEQNYKQLL